LFANAALGAFVAALITGFSTDVLQLSDANVPRVSQLFAAESNKSRDKLVVHNICHHDKAREGAWVIRSGFQ